MKIRKLHLKNIGVFDDEVIEFQPCPDKDKAEIHILTGENGSGKSTILMALAGAFDHFQFDTPQHPSNYLHKRFRDFEYIDGKDGRDNCKSSITVVFDENSKKATLVGDPRTNYVSTYVTTLEINQYRNLIIQSNKPTVALDFAAFAYSGYRHIKAEEIEAIRELKANPLLDSLEFKKTAHVNSFTINQWIANTISKSDTEIRKANFTKATKFYESVAALERAISDVVGYQVKFDLQTEPSALVVKIHGVELDFDVLPDGLRSLISWIGDLLMRVDSLKWNDDLPAFEKNLILFLDEIEVHLHPAWQRKVLPVVQKLFKNSQIFLSTHSPFVVNSVDGAWVYKLKVKNGKAHVDKPTLSEDGESYRYVLREIFDIKEDFGVDVQKQLEKFFRLRDKILKNKNGSVNKDKENLKKLALALASQSVELNTKVQFELRQLSKHIKEEISI